MARIGAFMHVNVNCRDLARSRRFYEGGLGLTATAHTRPEKPQPGEGFGLPGEVHWDAHILSDPRGFGASAALDLLQWELPTPIGTPPELAPTIGIHRLGYEVPSLADTIARLEEAGGRGGRPFSCERGGRTVELAWVRDPDGTVVELVEEPSLPIAVAARHVVLVCSDLGRSADWFESTLGLDVIATEGPADVPAIAFAESGTAVCEAAVLAAPGAGDGYRLRLERWLAPAAIARAPAVANQVGPLRVALLVDDVHAFHADLRRRGARFPSAPVWLDMGPEIPIDGLWALFFPDPDGACVELIQTPDPRG
jgi:catechol 2,3-dioxygenase-like lactoylglutathione lyase family enzyme